MLRDVTGKKLTVAAGDIVTFFPVIDPAVASPLGAVRSITVRTSRGSYPNWRVIVVQAANSPIAVSSNGHSPRYQRAYRGRLEITPLIDTFDRPTHRGMLRLVNILPIDDYLKGVVPWEMTPTAPAEALKAQAICARSETLAKIRARRHARDSYDICDFDHCQGYPGIENETARTSLAVQQTRGYILMHNGHVADAVYSTNSGGITAAAVDVWRGSGKPYLQSMRDISASKHANSWRLTARRMSEADWFQYCTRNWPSYAQPTYSQVRQLASRRASNPRVAALFGPQDLPEFYRWTRYISSVQLAKVFSSRPAEFAVLNGRPLRTISEIRVSERAASGHIKRLTIIGRDARNATVFLSLQGDSQIRAMLSGRLGSTTSLPSSTFVVVPNRDSRGVITSFTLRGAGWGHSTGMCQRGAQNRARDGWKVRQILGWYFRGTNLVKAY
jgi:peptidoglycan hydrolase-like amidase